MDDDLIDNNLYSLLEQCEEDVERFPIIEKIRKKPIMKHTQVEFTHSGENLLHLVRSNSYAHYRQCLLQDRYLIFDILQYLSGKDVCRLLSVR